MSLGFSLCQSQSFEHQLQMRIDSDSFEHLWDEAEKKTLVLDGNILHDAEHIVSISDIDNHPERHLLRDHPRARADKNGLITCTYALVHSKDVSPQVIARCGPGFAYALYDDFAKLLFGKDGVLRDEDTKWFQFVVPDLIQIPRDPLASLCYQDIVGVHEFGEEIFCDHDKARILEAEYGARRGALFGFTNWFANRKRHEYEFLYALVNSRSHMSDQQLAEAMSGRDLYQGQESYTVRDIKQMKEAIGVDSKVIKGYGG